MRRKQIIFFVGNAVPSVPCTNLRSVCCGTSKQIIFSVGNVVLDVPCRILRSGILRNAEDSVPYKSECIFTLASVFLHFDKGRFGAELAECLAIRRKQIISSVGNASSQSDASAFGASPGVPCKSACIFTFRSKAASTADLPNAGSKLFFCFPYYFCCGNLQKRMKTRFCGKAESGAICGFRKFIFGEQAAACRLETFLRVWYTVLASKRRCFALYKCIGCPNHAKSLAGGVIKIARRKANEKTVFRIVLYRADLSVHRIRLRS